MNDISEARSATPHSLDEIDFATQAVQNCPYPTYAFLRDNAPIWRDQNGHYQVTRYDILRDILRDSKNFTTEKSTEGAAVDQDKVKRIKAIYHEKGWEPEPTVLQLEGEKHDIMRRQFEKPFSASNVRLMQPLFEEVANSLLDQILEKEAPCEWVSAFSIPLPLTVILRQAGIPLEDMRKIRDWTDAWVQHHLGFVQDEDESRASAELEVERQHYFQPIFDRLRTQPDGSLVSNIVNAYIPELDRTFTDGELHTAIGIDLLVGGVETTTNAITHMMRILAERPDLWQQLQADPERLSRPFIEEVLRLEAPAQGLYRRTLNDVDLHGVHIPKGSIVVLRFGAANRDERQFSCPEDIDLKRRGSGAHLTFGSGAHHCLGATLTRAEIHCTLRTVLRRFRTMALAPGKGEINYVRNRSLRALKELWITFDPA